jgi:HSP20 family molecular chaperone IbpA
MRQLLTRLFDAAEGSDGNVGSSVVTSQWMPLVDIREVADRFVLQADNPGVDPQAIDVQMDKGLLTIKGERTHENGVLQVGIHGGGRKQRRARCRWAPTTTPERRERPAEARHPRASTGPALPALTARP